MNSVLRLGILGCADVVTRRMIPAFTAADGVAVTAIASRSQEKADSFAARIGAVGVSGYQTLLDREDVDAVYIPLPASMHTEWISRALLAGKHVLTEKPATTSAAETAEVAALARRNRLVLMENYMFVHHSQHAEVTRLLRAGAIGTVQTFTSAFMIPARPRDDIRYRSDLGGGALLDTGGYPVRAARLLLGDPLDVVGASERFDEDLGVDVGGMALLRAADGTLASVSYGLRHAYASFYELVGTAGILRLEHVFTTPADRRPVIRLTRDGRTEDLVLPADDQ